MQRLHPLVAPVPDLRAHHRGRPRRALAGALAAGLLGAPILAQVPLHVSPTSPAALGGETLDDSSLAEVDGLGGIHPYFVEGHWQATLGFVPGDLDAFGRRPGANRGSADSMAFSFLSEHAGFEDGDVLGFAPGGGLEVIVSETALAASLGLPTANLDVDALDFPTSDTMYYSLQSDLGGTVLGDLEDGDVLVYDLVQGLSFRVMTEAEVQACFLQATGDGSAIGDVQGLHCFGNELWFVPQGPSAYDGAVISCHANPYVVATEAEVGLGGAELNAMSLVRPGDDLPTLHMDRMDAVPGETAQLTIHGEPNRVYVGLFAGTSGYVGFRRRPGFGAWYEDPFDPWLTAILSTAPLPTAITDGTGTFVGSWTFPTTALWGPGFANEDGWTFQMVDAGDLRLSAPFRVEKL